MARIVIYSSLNIATVQLVRATLTQEGIVSYMGSVHLAPLGGEVPFDDARIELFVEEEDEARALAIINAQTGPRVRTGSVQVVMPVTHQTLRCVGAVSLR